MGNVLLTMLAEHPSITMQSGVERIADPARILAHHRRLHARLQVLNAAMMIGRISEDVGDAQLRKVVQKTAALLQQDVLILNGLLGWVDRDESGDFQGSLADEDLARICQQAEIHPLAVFFIAPDRRQGVLLQVREVQEPRRILEVIGREVVETWCTCQVADYLSCFHESEQPRTTKAVFAAFQWDFVHVALLLQGYPVAGDRLEPLRWMDLQTSAYLSLTKSPVAEFIDLLHEHKPTFRRLFEANGFRPFPCELRR